MSELTRPSARVHVISRKVVPQFCHKRTHPLRLRKAYFLTCESPVRPENSAQRRGNPGT
jgi:hypothetical protein